MIKLTQKLILENMLTINSFVNSVSYVSYHGSTYFIVQSGLAQIGHART